MMLLTRRVFVVLPLTALIVICSDRGRAATQEAGAPTDSVRFLAESAARFTRTDEHIELGGGLIRTSRAYSDLVMRFQFQFAEPETEAAAFVHYAMPAGAPNTGFRVHLGNRIRGERALGDVSGWGRRVYAQSSAAQSQFAVPVDEWHDCEIRAVRGTLSVRIDSVLVTTAQNLEGWAGYVGFQVGRGRIRVRRTEVESLPLAGEAFGAGAAQVKTGSGIDDPTVKKEVRPIYPRDVFSAGIQGEVMLEVVVKADGSVGDVRVVKPLHRDLDVFATAAARQWLFAPARKDGQAIDAIVMIALSFRIMG